MAKTRRDAAPNQEWVLMYRGGLTQARIAELVRAPASTVRYHLRIAAAADPGLRPAHEAAAVRKTMVTAQGLERMQQLVAMVQETGRYPSTNAESTSERTLASWLQRRREDARAGTLPPAFREGLAVLPGWEGKPRAEADEERWQVRLTALVAYRAAGNDWPRHKAFITGEEHDLGVWLHTQRYKARRGDLDPQKTDALDAAVPGWRTGRPRGRRAGSHTS
ncbi:helicase associated domain-containing protein [Arthrobacter sp. NPDC093139]|uniref:helicase associated domain-containing protein n=1 Tax=Arthrobacter sp. NPDC093139 TaxID=3363945 RepID=UPI0037F71071